MRKIVCCLLMLISAYCAMSQNDFSSVDQFWIIAARLSYDSIPSDKSWDELFKTPVYAVLKGWGRETVG